MIDIDDLIDYDDDIISNEKIRLKYKPTNKWGRNRYQWYTVDGQSISIDKLLSGEINYYRKFDGAIFVKKRDLKYIRISKSTDDGVFYS